MCVGAVFVRVSKACFVDVCIHMCVCGHMKEIVTAMLQIKPCKCDIHMCVCGNR